MMENNFRFEQFSVYKKAFTFVNTVYSITKSWPKEYQFELTSQFRRAGLSILLNIAEGSSRTKNDFRHFLIISRGSCFECSSLIRIAQAQNLIPTQEAQILYNNCIEIAQMLSGFRSALDKQ